MQRPGGPATREGIIRAHELETWSDGSASFVSARSHAWHRLGVVLPAGFDAAQAMRHARLGGWHVRKEPL